MLLSERSKIPAFATAPTITFQGFSTPAAAPIAMTYYESDPTSITYVMNQNVTIANTGGVWKNYAPTNVAGYKASIYTQTMYRTSNYA